MTSPKYTPKVGVIHKKHHINVLFPGGFIRNMSRYFSQTENYSQRETTRTTQKKTQEQASPHAGML